jgi:hypothetical protein
MIACVNDAVTTWLLACLARTHISSIQHPCAWYQLCSKLHRRLRHENALCVAIWQVNHSASFNIDSPLDKRIKQGLIADALRLVRIWALSMRSDVHCI